jgi:hypothetical protein
MTTNDTANGFRVLFNNNRYRSIFAGGLGGLLGWAVAEVIASAAGGPATLVGAGLMGTIVGSGIGLALSVAEGLVIGNWNQVRRGALIGAAVGALGGAGGAITAQGISATVGGGSAFSTEMRDRLAAAGAKQGTIEIALIWENTNDLDLHVEDPEGNRVWFQDKVSATGGELDVDRNAMCQRLTNRPVEHVVWTASSPPRGTYNVFVHHFQTCANIGPTNYRLEIKVGDAPPRVIERTSDPSVVIRRVDELPLIPAVTTFEYPPPIAKGGGWLVRLIGWTLFGILVGFAQGLVRGSHQAILHAAMGGALGGAAGGALFESIAASGITDVASRLAGFVILGACIGLCIVLVEQALSAVLWVTSGRYEGRQIILDRPEMRLGRQDSLEVYLGGDPQIAAHHASIHREGSGHVLSAVEGLVSVNGAPVSRCPLKDGDRFQIGATRFRYGRRENATSAQEHPSTTAPHAPTQPLNRPLPPPPPRAAPKPAATRTAAPPSSGSNAGAPQADGRNTMRGPPPPPPPPPRR